MRTSQLVDWIEVKSYFKKSNPDLYQAIESVPAHKRKPFVWAKYGYGDDVVKLGEVYLPTQGHIHPLSSRPKADPIAQTLRYSSIPLGFCAARMCEVFVPLKHRIIPLNTITPGNCFGLFETLGGGKLPPVWHVCAGARSMFLLPCINDTAYFNRLKKKYALSQGKPSLLYDHGKLFHDIAKNGEHDWACDVFFFTSGWFEDSGPDWAYFRNQLMKMGWQQTQYIRQEHAYSFMWEMLMEAISQSKLKPTPYQMDTVKHLISMHFGAYPGFVPSDASGLAGPTQYLQDVFVQVYGLNGVLPTMMEPAIMRGGEETVYYSLSHPTMPEGAHLKSPRGIVQDVISIREILQLFDAQVQQYQYAQNQHMITLPKYTFYHTTHADARLQKFTDIIKADPKFVSAQLAFPEHKFSEHSPFGRGCIQIQAA